MCELAVSLNSVMAWTLWVVGVALAAGDLVITGLGDLGVCLAAAGATLHVRGMLAGQRERERNAFQLGKDAAELGWLTRD